MFELKGLNMNITRNVKKEKGITLIALVITVIILLIMASITTSRLDEMNNVVKQAEETKEFVELKGSIDYKEENSTNSDAISYIIK